MAKKTPELADFPSVSHDKLRYADTDRQGHVNNATFSTFLETGRVELLYHPDFPILSPDASFVIASLKLNFLREIKWPGRVDIGTGVVKVGNSSITMYQALFQNGLCVADAETIIVQVSNHTSASMPLIAEAKSSLKNWQMSAP